MSITIKRAALWRVETANSPGALAETLRPLAESRTNLEIVMGYAAPDRTSAVIEVSPMRTPIARKAARTAGLSKSSFPCIIISGDNRPGIGHQIAAALAREGININFFVAQTLGDRYTGLFSFEAATEAELALRTIRSALRRRIHVANSPSPRDATTNAGRRRPDHRIRRPRGGRSTGRR